jgi:hypothetical protein
MLIAMKDKAGQRLTFSTSSVGGRNAVRKMLRGWRRDRPLVDVDPRWGAEEVFRAWHAHCEGK